MKISPKKSILFTFILLGSILNYNDIRVEGSVFNAIVPNLSTGWFHKPGPTESILFGLIVLKVLALRMAGVFPYNLNELVAEGGYLDNTILKEWRKSSSRTQRDLYFMKSGKNKLNTVSYSKAPLLKELDVVERMLTGLRRIDSHDCFIRHICEVNQNSLTGKSTKYDEAILKIFRLKPKKVVPSGEKSIWDIYHDALSPTLMDCNQKYQLCPLTKKDMSLTSILNGLF